MEPVFIFTYYILKPFYRILQMHKWRIIIDLHAPITQLQQLSTTVNSTFHTDMYSVSSSNQVSKISELSADQKRDYSFCFIHRILPHRNDDMSMIIYLVLELRPDFEAYDSSLVLFCVCMCMCVLKEGRQLAL